MKPVTVVILGAGAWGTALAIQAARKPGAHVRLWTPRPALAAHITQQRENSRYLPGQALPANVQAESGPLEALLESLAAVSTSTAAQPSHLIMLASPMAALREQLRILGLQGWQQPVAWVCKGFEAESGLLGHEICARVAPNLLAGLFSGPSFAQEVAAGLPSALLAASPHAVVRQALLAAFHGDGMRVYEGEDMLGAEVGGAVKNVLAIATGLCDGLGFGLNARAALITRGLAEMTRLGVALGARLETFMGLTGMGDLVLTATGNLSRNRQVGLQLAQGKTLAEATESLGHVAEGVYCARTTVARAHSLGIEMPISQAVVALLEGTLRSQDVAALLLGRQSKAERAI